MSWFMVDVETDGPVPGLYSMIEIGVVRIDPDKPGPSFYSKLRPHNKDVNFLQEALDVTGWTRHQTLQFDDPSDVMIDLNDWLLKNSNGQPRFISDNNGFDWQFVNYYFWYHLNTNPFGHSSTNLGSLYKGLVKTTTKNFKHLRKTKHTHNPVDDCIGNIEALMEMRKMGLYFPL